MRPPRTAGLVEVWAARAWNVLNEGRPFSIVFPAIVLALAVPLGLAPLHLGLAFAGAVGMALLLSPFTFPLRGRVLLWVALAASLPLLQPWREPVLIAFGIGVYAAFTILFWGTLYYRLRTGAPWTNFTRFWRLVLTNSDPTSGNALEQVPKLVMTLGAADLLARRPSGAGIAAVLGAAAIVAALGTVAWLRFYARRMPRYPDRRPAGAASNGRGARSRRVYVIVVDGCNRRRLWQTHAPTLERLAAEGTEYLNVEPAYPARTVPCFSSMLTGATPREHGMRSNFVLWPGVRRESVFDVLARRGRRGRLVGIAHLLDAFPKDVVRTVTSVQRTDDLDRWLMARGISVVNREDPDLLVLQLLAADQTGHVRGVRSNEYARQLAHTDRRIGEFLGWLGAHGKLEDATVVVMADHGQGRGIGGHGHFDWGESPVPFIVWGAGAVPGTVNREPRSILELATTVTTLLGVEAPAAARGRPLVPALDRVERPVAEGARALALVVARDEERSLPGVLGGLPERACGLPLDVLVVDDGSRDMTAALARRAGATVISHGRSRGLGAALRTGLEHARDRGYAAVAYLDGDGEYDPREIQRVLAPVARGRADYVLGSRFLGRRRGMSWHRSLLGRLASALMGTLMGTVMTDAQTGYRAFSGRALAAARIRHDYNYAQVLTLGLWGAGFEPIEVPISYTRRRSGRSFIRYPEYLVRVVPAVLREWIHARAAIRRRTPAVAAVTAYGNGELPKNGNAATSGPHGAAGRSAASPPVPSSTST